MKKPVKCALSLRKEETKQLLFMIIHCKLLDSRNSVLLFMYYIVYGTLILKLAIPQASTRVIAEISFKMAAPGANLNLVSNILKDAPPQ